MKRAMDEAIKKLPSGTRVRPAGSPFVNPDAPVLDAAARTRGHKAIKQSSLKLAQRHLKFRRGPSTCRLANHSIHLRYSS